MAQLNALPQTPVTAPESGAASLDFTGDSTGGSSDFGALVEQHINASESKSPVAEKNASASESGNGTKPEVAAAAKEAATDNSEASGEAQVNENVVEAKPGGSQPESANGDTDAMPVVDELTLADGDVFVAQMFSQNAITDSIKLSHGASTTNEGKAESVLNAQLAGSVAATKISEQGKVLADGKLPVSGSAPVIDPELTTIADSELSTDVDELILAQKGKVANLSGQDTTGKVLSESELDLKEQAKLANKLLTDAEVAGDKSRLADTEQKVTVLADKLSQLRAQSSIGNEKKTVETQQAATLEDQIPTDELAEITESTARQGVDSVTKATVTPLAGATARESGRINQSTAELVRQVTPADVDADTDGASQIVDSKLAAGSSGQTVTAETGDKLGSWVSATRSAEGQPQATATSVPDIKPVTELQASGRIAESGIQATRQQAEAMVETIAIHRKDFTNAVHDKVMMMMNQRLKHVEIRLDPPELGSMQIRLNLQNDQANVQFIVQNATAKEAIEHNMAKLREMMAERGVDVGDANIEQQDRRGQEGEEAEGQQASNFADGSEEWQNTHESDSVPLELVKGSTSGVDYYA